MSLAKCLGTCDACIYLAMGGMCHMALSRVLCQKAGDTTSTANMKNKSWTYTLGLTALLVLPPKFNVVSRLKGMQFWEDACK